MTTEITIEFDCPRCGKMTTERFYGPCTACRTQVRNLAAPPPDPRFIEVSKADGSRYVTFTGGSAPARTHVGRGSAD